MVRAEELSADTNPDTCHLAGFEERGRGPLEARACSSLPSTTVELARWEPCQTVGLPSCEVTSGCCFKP